MKSHVASLLKLKSEMICLSLALLTSACSPTAFNGTEVVSSSLQASNTSSTQGQDSITGIPANSDPVSVTPNKSAVPLIDDSQFGNTIVNIPKCEEVTQDPLAFEILSSSGAISSLQVTQVPPPQAFGGSMIPMDSYTVYSLFQGDDGLIGVSEYSEVTVDNTRVYGFYNCGFQTMVVNEKSSAMGIDWLNAAPHLKIHSKISSASVKLVGFAVVNQHTKQATVRCVK